MNELLTRIQRIQRDFQTLSKELEDVLREHAPNQQPNQQVILPARKRGVRKRKKRQLVKLQRKFRKQKKQQRILL
jgi:ElaB/YqjD/DUF883 family membrane-anchored ribosome-binding protein